MIEYGGPASVYKYGMPTKFTVRMQDLLGMMAPVILVGMTRTFVLAYYSLDTLIHILDHCKSRVSKYQKFLLNPNEVLRCFIFGKRIDSSNLFKLSYRRKNRLLIQRDYFIVFSL